MHERAAEALGLRGHYQLIEVAGADRDGLRMMLEGVRRLGFAGVNVTFPYKEAVVPLLDELAPGAAAMGAVNTVVVKRRPADRPQHRHDRLRARGRRLCRHRRTMRSP